LLLLDRREVFARHSLSSALVLEALVGLALLSGAFPFALANPIWWLRLSDAAVALAPALLLAVLALHLGAVLLERDADLGLVCGRRRFQLARRWAVLFALLVPLQLLGVGWLWIDSQRQLDARVSQVESERASLLSPLLASRSEAELGQRLTQIPPGGFPAPPASLLSAGASLTIQKQGLSDATEGALATIKRNLRKERNTLLRNSLPGSLRVLIGAAILSAFLYTITRQTSQWDGRRGAPPQ
jgi:hypothetical protein